MPSEITFRNGRPAINVKDDGTFPSEPLVIQAALNALPRSSTEAAYSDALRDFWDHASTISKTFGYGEVFQEGRSGGWLLVDNPPVLDLERQALDGTDLETTQSELITNREEWARFEGEIERAIVIVRDVHRQRLREMHADFLAQQSRVNLGQRAVYAAAHNPDGAHPSQREADECVVEALMNIMHFCSAGDLDYEKLNALAVVHFREEPLTINGAVVLEHGTQFPFGAIRGALEGDSNDAEHEALVAVAEALAIPYTPSED